MLAAPHEGWRGPRCVQTPVVASAHTGMWTAGLLPWLLGLCLVAGAQEPAPQLSPATEKATTEKTGDKPTRPARRLKLDIDKHVEKKLEEEAKKAPPRFETSIEVVARSPQALLERFFGGVDLECGPGGGGAPTVEEMRQYRPHAPPSADFLALAMALAGKVMDKIHSTPATPKYFLYRVRRKDAGVSYALREDRVPDAWFYNFPDLNFELVETFTDKDTAVRGWRRMERGYGSPVAAATNTPPPQWATTPCRPRR